MRAVVFALPFAAWFAWSWIARRGGRQVGPAPWTWLFAAGAALTALSLMATVVFDDDRGAAHYAPPQFETDVTP